MLIRGFRKYTMNPALGMLPIGVFLFLNACSVQFVLSVLIAICLSFLFDVIFRYFLRMSASWLISAMSIVPLSFTGIFTLFSPVDNIQPNNYMVICEIWLVITLVVIHGFRRNITSHYFCKIDIREKKLLHEFFSTTKLAEHLFTLHLFVVLAYSFLMHSYGFEGWDYTIYVFTPLFIIASLIVYGSYLIRSLSVRFFKEEWLPIVNEQGKVIGKVAKSVSYKMKNHFLHPIVRIALVCNGAIYLQKRPESSLFEPSLIDHPFEKYMLFGHETDLVVKNCMNKYLEGESLPFTYQLKYIFETCETKRLVLFFVSNVKSTDEIKNICSLKGKFWTMKQIEDELDSKIFSECFLREYEYMKNTVLNPAIQSLVK